MADSIIDNYAFIYPPAPLVRRHGPQGYDDYRSYRPWLRDEFTFRCAYCLMREQWGRVTGEFDVEHFVPHSAGRDVVADYDRLLYACHVCNLRKGVRSVPDPSLVLNGETVIAGSDGTLHGKTAEAERLIRILCLNSRLMVRWRRMWIRIVMLAARHEPETFVELMRFPDDLPDLSQSNVPTNTRPDGLQASHYARRNRGELEEWYSY